MCVLHVFVDVGGTGESGAYRLTRHSGPITAPVMPSQQELNVATVTRGVATANQVYLGPTDTAMPPYLPVATPGPVGVDYHLSAHVGSSVATYPVVPTPQQLDIDRLKLQHEVVKQVVESSSNFPKDGTFSSVGRAYNTSGRTQQEWVSPGPVSQSSSYCMSLSQQSSLPSYECSPRLASDTQSAAILSQQHGGQSAAILSQQHAGQSAAILSQQHAGQSAAILSQLHAGQSAALLPQQHGGQSAALLPQQHGGQSAAILPQQHGGQSAAILSQQLGGQSAALLPQQHGGQSAALLPQQHGGQSAAILSQQHGGQSAAILSQQHGGHGYSTEQLLANMQDLRISQGGQECQVPSSGDFPPSLIATQCTTTPSSSTVVTPSSTLAITSGHAVSLTKSVSTPHSAYVLADVSSSGMSSQSPSRATVTSSATAGGDSSVGGGALEDRGSSSSKELEAEIFLLKEQLRERNQTIQQQQVQLQGVTHPPASGVQGGRYLISQQQHAYPNVPTTHGVGVQLIASDDPSSVAYGSHYLPQATQQAQPPQYTPQQIQAALVLLMGAKGGGNGAGSSLPLTPGSNYYPNVPVASSYQAPQQWSGPQPTPPAVGVYSGGPHSMPIGSNVTPPGTGYLMSLPGNNSMPANASQPSRAINPALAPSLSSGLQPSDHPDDGMLAAYIQMMEQNKAASGGPAYHSSQHQQHPSIYAPTQNQYYYQQ